MALFLVERIRTTEAKAKELRRWADKMITLAKKGDLAARRQALSILPNKMVVRKLFGEIRDRYLDRESGFTRIVRLAPRRGDAAMIVFIELVTDQLEHRRSSRKISEEKQALSEAPEALSEAAIEVPETEEKLETKAEEKETAEVFPEESSPEAKTKEEASEEPKVKAEEPSSAKEEKAEQETLEEVPKEEVLQSETEKKE